jgi:hypothetical protein
LCARTPIEEVNRRRLPESRSLELIDYCEEARIEPGSFAVVAESAPDDMH